MNEHNKEEKTIDWDIRQISGTSPQLLSCHIGRVGTSVLVQLGVLVPGRVTVW